MNDKFFPVSCFRGVGQGEQGPEPIPAAQAGATWEPILDRTLFHGRAQSHTPTQHPVRQLRHASLLHGHIFGMWEEMEYPRENPHRHGENMEMPHRSGLGQELIFFFFNPPQHYREATLFVIRVSSVSCVLGLT